MHNKHPLKGKTIVLTGSKKTRSVLKTIEQLGAEGLPCSLIKTVELEDSNDSIQLELAKTFDWLIFTSQNAVEAFCAKIKRHNLTPSLFKGKIAVVGSKTRDLLVNNGFNVDFVPSIYSADVFVKEFPLLVKPNSKCLFVRGTKAKNTIRDGLPFDVNEWNVYTTVDNLDSIHQMINLIRHRKELIVIFASPSAVEVYALHIAPHVGWEKVKIASIGHITSNALKKYDAHVSYQPKTYTMEAVIEEIVKMEGLS